MGEIQSLIDDIKRDISKHNAALRSMLNGRVIFNKSIGGNMCYNDCVFFSFNPMTGMDRCVRPNDGPCPDELASVYCKKCEEEYELPEGSETCPVCGNDELEEI